MSYPDKLAQFHIGLNVDAERVTKIFSNKSEKGIYVGKGAKTPLVKGTGMKKGDFWKKGKEGGKEARNLHLIFALSG